jgi:hypothetical protein
VQRNTGRPVPFELTEHTRQSVAAGLRHAGRVAPDYLFPSRRRRQGHLSTRQYARLVQGWVSSIGRDPAMYGTHSLRRTKPTLIYRRPRAFGPSSCCWVIRSSRAPSGISGSN